jgi:hypothetical protein
MEHTETTKEQDALLKKTNNGIGLELYRLTDVATWLRTVHGWHVAVISTNKNKFWLFIVTDCEGFEYHYGKADDENTFNTHDLALSAGIDFILTKLNEDDHNPTN